MTVGARHWIVVALAGALMVAFGALPVATARDDPPLAGPTVGERLVVLRVKRASLQARADSEARIALLSSFRVAGQLGDALSARSEADRERGFDDLPPPRRQAFAELEALNDALEHALSRPGAGSTTAARAATQRAIAALERLAGADNLPLVLQFTPRFVAPRRATGDMTLAPAPPVPPPTGDVRLPAGSDEADDLALPTMLRYAPPFAAAREEDPPVIVEVVGLRLAPSSSAPPILVIGDWRGVAAVAPERLRFAVPRSAFPTDAVRSSFVSGSLILRHDGRIVPFELLFVVLPDRPGSFALDQRLHAAGVESRTLVSPEILARGAAGKPQTVRRCFDPPQGWRFDKQSRRMLVVERLGWVDALPDATVNGGSVEFAADEGPAQICVVASARPASKQARTATIGRFEVTLVRDRTEDRTVKSGVRALDWREAVRVPIEPDVQDWRLYLRLFGEIDREYRRTVPDDAPFLRVTIEGEGDDRAMVLEADPAADP